MRSRVTSLAVGGVFIAALACARAAGAESVSENQYSMEDQIPRLEQQATLQDAQLDQQIQEISAVGEDLEQAQSRAESAETQVQDYQQKSSQLQSEVSARQQDVADSQRSYEDRVRAAYKGEDLAGISALIGSVLGDGGSPLADVHLVRSLSEGREALHEYQDSQQYLENSKRQLNTNKKAYQQASEEQKSRGTQLSQREQRLRDSIHRLRSSKDRTMTRLHELRKAERARIQAQQAATSVGNGTQARELKIAHRDIVAHPVKDISKKRYKKLYRESARKYGFARDWYILAAVGRVESNHGENMGPSSSGALGPMQFLPSTWKTSGVDGNGDGEANIMDPRDAIPAAAKYLKTGGAPEDWYAALYSYNHADWYVEEVLGVAEAYRRMADDHKVGPYTRIEERDSGKK